MTTITFDYFKRLEQVGFTREQASVLVALATEGNNEMVLEPELQKLEKDIRHDIELSESKIENAFKELKIELLREIQAVRVELGNEIKATRLDLEHLKGDVKLIKGLVVFLAGVISTASVLFGMIKFFL